MNKSFEIKIPRLLAPIILWITQFFGDRYFMLVCKGYGEDYELYTGLDWGEDKNLDFIGDKSYEDFRLWINI